MGKNDVDSCAGSDARRAFNAKVWLSAGAMTLSLGAAMIGGAAVASADAGSSDGASSSNSSSSSSSGEANSAASSSPSSTSTKDADTNSTTTSTANVEPTTTPSNQSDSTYGSATDAPGKKADESTTTPSTAPRAQTNTGTFETSTTKTGTGDSESTPAKDDEKKDTTSAAPIKSTSAEPITSTSAEPIKSVTASDSPVSDDRSTAAAVATTAAVQTVAPSVIPAAVPTITAWAPPALPTPAQILAGLQEFGNNLYLAAMNQVYGLQRNLEVLRDDVATIFGIRQVVVTQPLPYGNPAATVQYYVAANDYYSAALATVAMAFGQLTGTTPDLQGITDLAETTDSIVNSGEKIYLGPGSTQFVKWTDSYELLQDKNVRIIIRSYGTDQWSKAFNDLTNGLQDSTKAMIVAMNGLVDGVSGQSSKSVVVLGVDNVNGTVTINDPTRADGQGLTMSIDDFMNGWSGQNYKLITTQLASTPSTPPPAPSTTTLEWSLPRPDQIGQAVQSAFSGIAQAVVHQIDGARASLADLGSDLAYAFGVADPVDVTPPAPEDIEYGNYAKNLQYWIYQGNYNTCALMAVAGAIGQLTGVLPPAQQIIDQATSTPSGVKDGPMYDGTGTHNEDVVTLLNMNGLNADFTSYLTTDGTLALQNMTAALTQGQAVIVQVANNAVYNAYSRAYFNGLLTFRVPDAGVRANHAVIVLSVDTTKNLVYLNDSAWQRGQGLPVPLDEFMKAWQYSDFSTMTAELRTT